LSNQNLIEAPAELAGEQGREGGRGEDQPAFIAQ
jgi:hypothetical protein